MLGNKIDLDIIIVYEVDYAFCQGIKVKSTQIEGCHLDLNCIMWDSCVHSVQTIDTLAQI